MRIVLSIMLLFSSLTVFSQKSEKESNDRGYIVKIGDMAPDFTIQYLDGSTKKLSDLRGKVIMLQFTASWCGVCRKEMPHIESDIWQKNKSNSSFALLGIDYKESSDKVKAFIEKTQVTYPLVLDETGDIFHKYAAKGAGVTRNIIIDRQGKIIFLTRLFDENEFKQMVQTIDKELKKK